MDTIETPFTPETGRQFWPPLPEAPAGELVEKARPGTLILLPFATPSLPVEALFRAGSKVLAANGEPLPLLMLSAQLTAIDKETIQKAFLGLGDALKGNQPLHQHLANLYRTTCPQCRASLQADYFVWQREMADPQQKALRCADCGFAGLAPVTEADLETLDRIETRGVHYHFLLGRAVSAQAAEENALRVRLEALHDLYTPRALYAIAELIMKIEATLTDRALQRVFKAILFNCLLPASNLIATPGQQSLPKRLKPPARYLEANLWQLFQAAVSAWQPPQQTVRFAPRLDDFLQQHQNAVCFFPDEAGSLRRYLPEESVTVLAADLPPPGPVRWALSTLWSGWLLGLKAAEMASPFLLQKWPDWLWYQRQLSIMLRILRASLEPDAACWLTASMSSRLQAPAIILAALQAGYDVEAWDIEQAGHRIWLTLPGPDLSPPMPLETLAGMIQAEARETAGLFLQKQPSPISDDAVYWVVWQSLLYSGLLVQTLTSLSEKRRLTWIDKQVQAALSALDI